MTGPDIRGWAGHARGWRYLGQKIDGDGGLTWLEPELPIENVQLTFTVSGPPSLTGTISPVQLRELGIDHSPRLGEWSTLVHAEADDAIVGSYFLVGSKLTGPKWDLDCPGMSYYPKGQPYPGDRSYTGVDPLTVVRDIWLDLMLRPHSNIGMLIDGTTQTPVTLGSLADLSATATGTAAQTSGGAPAAAQDKPYEINWWSTNDCGGVIDQLAQGTPFQYRERHTWNTDHTAIHHYLDFGYPGIGVRRGLRFTIGENIQVLPEVDRDGENWANEVIVLGAGEGSAMTRGSAVIEDGRIRRTVSVSDSSITDKPSADAAARIELAARNQLVQMTNVVVRNMPSHAKFGEFQVGDEIRVVGRLPWIDVDNWFLITSMTITPGKPDAMSLTLLRSDWMTL